MTEASDIELLFSVWEQNLDTVRTLNKLLNRESRTFLRKHPIRGTGNNRQRSTKVL
jgi:hypothetical protein